MGEVVDLQLTKLRDDESFVLDLTRFSEGVLSEQQVRRKWHLVSNETWDLLADDELLIERVEETKVQRIRSGAVKRELAQKHVVAAPTILHGILVDAAANPRHRIDSAKALDDMAADRHEIAAAAADRFIISIDLGEGHVETFNKPLAVDASDGNGAPEVKSPVVDITAIDAVPAKRRGRPRKIQIQQGDTDAGTTV